MLLAKLADPMSTFSPFPTCCCFVCLISSPGTGSRRSIQTAPTGPSREDEWCVFLCCKWVVEFDLAMNLALGNAHRCICWTNTRQMLPTSSKSVGFTGARSEASRWLLGAQQGSHMTLVPRPASAAAPRSAVGTEERQQRGHLQVRPDGQVRRKSPA